MAEWAYLWLQTQHLHGIDHDEAVRYMLEGATARSETATRIQLVSNALSQARAQIDQNPAKKSDSMDVVGSTLADDSQRTLVTAEIEFLLATEAVAIDHHRIVSKALGDGRKCIIIDCSPFLFVYV